MNRFQIAANHYLDRRVDSFYNVPYTRMGTPGNPDYVNDLKNTFNNFPRVKLDSSTQQLRSVLEVDLPNICQSLGYQSLVACVVPRAKAECEYSPYQQRFRFTVQAVVRDANVLIDGTHYLMRHTSTRTTHLDRKFSSNDARDPYPGITEQTCDISPQIRDKDVLLVDDIYTPGVNIDEDAIQALFNAGARAVYFYAVGRVIR